MSTEISDKLCKPFPPEAVQQRRGGGGYALSYYDTQTIIRRLNDATGNSWSLEAIRIWEADGILFAHVKLTIPGLGSREHIGVQKIEARSGEDIYKGCVSDALKKAATLFGVGLELYGPDYEAEAAEREEWNQRQGEVAGAGKRTVMHGRGGETPVTETRARARGASRKAQPQEVPPVPEDAEGPFHPDTQRESEEAKEERTRQAIATHFKNKVSEISEGRWTLSTDDTMINLVNRCAGKIRIGRGDEWPTKEDMQAALNGLRELVAQQKRQEERGAQREAARVAGRNGENG
jgi:hypothetical protein